MTAGGRTEPVLYVAPDGTVRSGRLVEPGLAQAPGTTALVSRGGEPLAPSDVRALLALPGCRRPQRAALLRANQAGYRVEEA